MLRRSSAVNDLFLYLPLQRLFGGACRV